jgi:hypothetical protein
VWNAGDVLARRGPLRVRAPAQKLVRRQMPLAFPEEGIFRKAKDDPM